MYRRMTIPADLNEPVEDLPEPEVPENGYTLSQLQSFVGGYFERVLVEDLGGNVRLLICDEDGRAKGLPPNPRATAFCGRSIVGPAAVILEGDLK